MDEERSPQPTFRKPSLALEAEASLMDSAKLVPSASTDSLANNTTGTTFAAKARAAELQAARARKQLKENDKQNEPASSATPHEVMTFTKARSKAGKTWKTLNLHDLPEASSEDFQNSMYRTSPDLTAPTNSYLSTKGLESGYDNGQGFADVDSKFNGTEPFPKVNMLTSSQPQTGLSPDTQKLVKSVENYDVSQWDPELPAIKSSRAQGSSDSVSPRNRTRTSSTTFALRPLPVLTTSSDQLQKQALYLHRKQESQLSEVHAALNGHLHNPREAKDIHETVESVMAMLAQDKSSNRFLPESAGLGTDEDPFAASPSPMSPPLFAPQQPYSGQEMKYGVVGPAPRKFVPHQYPAVKGTTNAIPRLGLQRKLAPDHSTQQHHDYFPPDQNTCQYPRASGTKEPQTPYRKLSVAEKKGILLQQLQTVVDESASSAGYPKSGRTVLHDPFAYKNDDVEAKTPPALLTNSETDLVIASDPLPWKTRPVNIVRPSPFSNDESTPTSDRKLTPIEVRPFRRGLYRGQRLTANFTDVESWWSTDSRIDSLSKKQITDFLGCVRESPEGKSAEVPRQRGILSESENSDAAIKPGYMQRDVGKHLLVPVLANLQTYLNPGGYFNKHGRVAEWCIDQGANGQTSFFGEDWGAPPPRVGRDPRYQPVLHEGIRSVYENLGTRWGSDGYPRRYPIR